MTDARIDAFLSFSFCLLPFVFCLLSFIFSLTRARDGSGSLPKGVCGSCWQVAADGRKPPNGLQMPCSPEGAITDSPYGAQKIINPFA